MDSLRLDIICRSNLPTKITRAEFPFPIRGVVDPIHHICYIFYGPERVDGLLGAGFSL